MKLLLSFACVFIMGCAATNNLNQQIDLPEAQRKFLAEAVISAVDFLGNPTISIQKVYIRFSDDTRSTSPRTDLINREAGEFAIYLSQRPTDDFFYGQLAHEIVHLINWDLADCYIEGLGGVFAERLLTSKGLGWSEWHEWFRLGNEPLYASSYLMMREVILAAGEEFRVSMLRFARWSTPDKQTMHIDINGWIQSLPVERRAAVKATILKHARAVQQANAASGREPLAFELPR